MSYLLYCVFRSGQPPEFEMHSGIRGEPVQVIDHGGLCAAVSELQNPDSPPDVATVLAYENVVESFFNQRTIIPMRFGCSFHGRLELAALLDERHKEYDLLLARLDGLVEMGIQVTPEGHGPGLDLDSTGEASADSPAWGQSGASYLLAKKQYYGSADRMTERRDGLVKTLCDPLSSMFVRHKVETSPGGAHLASLYFLVPRSSVADFREAIPCRLNGGLVTLAVTGPWPPYNFVDLSNLREAV
ncbi:MAG TPA: GvpL/GvpF family gas vesicle protein [Terriglobales bacterium]